VAGLGRGPLHKTAMFKQVVILQRTDLQQRNTEHQWTSDWKHLVVTCITCHKPAMGLHSSHHITRTNTTTSCIS